MTLNQKRQTRQNSKGYQIVIYTNLKLKISIPFYTVPLQEKNNYSIIHTGLASWYWLATSITRHWLWKILLYYVVITNYLAVWYCSLLHVDQFGSSPKISQYRKHSRSDSSSDKARLKAIFVKCILILLSYRINAKQKLLITY